MPSIQPSSGGGRPELYGSLCRLEKSGAQGRDRTADTAIFSRMLYQLSYLGAQRAKARGRRAP